MNRRCGTLCFLTLSALVTSPTDAGATPGPDSVAVLSNASVPESLALGQQYAAARDVPAAQVCPVAVPDQDDITLDQFRMTVMAPLEQCLMSHGVLDRIESIVVMRGIPIRVNIGTRPVSLAAALGAWHSRVVATSVPLVGEEPGVTIMCATAPCYGAAWSNPYRTGDFRAGWTATAQGVEWHPMLVTMLNARSYTDAARLITSAIAAERMGGARGRFLFMEGADPLRASLDVEYDGVMDALRTDGYSDVARVPFDSNTSGMQLAAFFTGSPTLGTTIESNTYLPGSLTDNLTSLGADPINFHATGQSQTSIARFVAAGASGAHGAVAEPLHTAFPSRRLIVDYVQGFTLAESYLRNMPYAYWRNLVLGDPMLAPYASRPTVTISGLTSGETHAGTAMLDVRATAPSGRSIATIALYEDGIRIAHVDGDHLSTCWNPMGAGAHRLLAVAQLGDDATHRAPQSKGWLSIDVTSVSGRVTCDATGDAGSMIRDGADGGSAASMRAGCGCSLPGDHARRGAALLVVVMALAGVRRRK